MSSINELLQEFHVLKLRKLHNNTWSPTPPPPPHSEPPLAEFGTLEEFGTVVEYSFGSLVDCCAR